MWVVTLGERGGRPAGGTDREKRVLEEVEERGRAARVGELPRAEHRRRMRIRSDEARGAGGAVLRGLEVADEVVVLELRDEQEDGVERDPDYRAGAPASISELQAHRVWIIRPGARRRQPVS